MKKIVFSLLLFSLLLLGPLGAQENQSINTNTSQNVLQRQAVMENEMRELRGRIEFLEHQLRTAQTEASSQSISVPQQQEALSKSHVFTQAGKTGAMDNKGTRFFTPPQETIISSADEKYKKAHDLITMHKYDEAKVLLQELTQEYPGNKISIDAHYWLGEIAFINGQHEEAAVAFGDSYGTYEKLKKQDSSVQFSKAANSLIQLARCLNKMGRRAQAIATLKQLKTEFPKHPRKIIAIMAKRAREEIEDRRPRSTHS